MKKLNDLRSATAFLLTFLSAILIDSNSSLSAQTLRVAAVSDLKRVFPDGYNLPPASDTLMLSGMRGEVLSGQIFVFAKTGLIEVSLNPGELKLHGTDATLKTGCLSWNFIGNIPLTKNTPNQPLTAVVRKAPSMFPDYLMSERQINIPAKSYQGVWITVDIPVNAIAGNYEGILTVTSSKGEQSLPVELTVYPLTLPPERHLKVVEWYTTSRFPEFHGIKEKYTDAWFAMLKIYAENMVAHRQNVFTVPMGSIKISRLKTGILDFDFTNFDKIAQVFWNTGKMDDMQTGELTKFGKKGWSDTEIVLADFDVTDQEDGSHITIPGAEVIPYLLPAFESHLRMKGWLSKTQFGIKDEPSLHNALAWKNISSYIHKLAPDLRRMDAIETSFLLDEIEVAVPKLDALSSWYDKYKTWEQEGNELWFYTVGIYQGSLFPNKTIDVPIMDSRIMHWLNYKYDATGYLHWGWNQWTEDPYKDPGMHIGDAWHVYPVKDGVLNSLRWEEMRNGIQDYEYFRMLEDKTRVLKDSLGSGFSWIDPKQRGKEIASTVVMGFAEHTNDPTVLYNARSEIIKELLASGTSPRVYVQTDPVEYSSLTSHSSVAVYGWTEPGTKIIINGTEIPVSNEGLFLEQLGGEVIDPSKIHLGTKITVRAMNSSGSKEITRYFNIKN